MPNCDTFTQFTFFCCICSNSLFSHFLWSTMRQQHVVPPSFIAVFVVPHEIWGWFGQTTTSWMASTTPRNTKAKRAHTNSFGVEIQAQRAMALNANCTKGICHGLPSSGCLQQYFSSLLHFWNSSSIQERNWATTRNYSNGSTPASTSSFFYSPRIMKIQKQSHKFKFHSFCFGGFLIFWSPVPSPEQIETNSWKSEKYLKTSCL